MKKAIRALTAALLAVLLAAGASAALPGRPAEPLPVVPDGMEPLTVTSSLADSGEETGVLFDGDTATALELTFDEAAGTKTFTLRMATGIPQPLSAFALVTDAGKGAVLNIRIWGTNDSTEKEWTPLSIHAPVVKTGEWNVFTLTEPEGGWQNAAKYAFYRLEITVEDDLSFTFGECRLIRPVTDEPELFYETVEVVEEGQTPPVAAAEESPALPRRLRFGLFFPGIMK